MKVEIAPEYRTLSRRILASIFDELLLLPLTVLYLVVYNSDVSPLSRMVWFVVVALAPFFYSVFMHHKYGKTLGKLSEDLLVTSLDGNLPSWRQAIQRNIIFIAILAVVLFYDLPKVRTYGQQTGLSIPFEDPLRRFNAFYAWGFWRIIQGITAFFDRRSRGIHDYLGQTVVIIPTKLVNNSRQRQSLLFLLLLLCVTVAAQVGQAVKSTKPIEYLSDFQVQINSPIDSTVIKPHESVPIDWIISPAPHGYFHADVYFATDPNFEHRFDGYGQGNAVHNLGGVMRKQAEFQWHLQVEEDDLPMIPTKIYLQIKISSSLTETETVTSNIVMLNVAR